MKLFWWFGLAAALALTLAGNLGPWRNGDPPPAIATWWWLGALACLLLGSLAADLRRPPASAKVPWTRTHWLALLSIVVVAAAFRLWGITIFPPPHGFGFEEYQTGGNAYHTYEDWTWFTEFPLTNFLPGVAFRVFGLSSYSLRAPFLLSGIVAPIFLFLALRRLLTLPAAWGAAFLLAANRWAASAARFADEIYFPISIVAICAWLTVCVAQQRRLTTAFVLGLVSADLFYAYTGYRLLPPLAFGLAVAVVVWRHWRGRPTGGAWPVLVNVAVVWVIMIRLGVAQVPGDVAADSVFFEALRRHTATWSERQAPLAERLDNVVSHFNGGLALFATRGEAHAWINIPEQPMFDPLTATLAALAVLFAVLRLRNAWRLATLLLLVVPFVAVGFFATNFNGQRYFVFLVPIFALIGFLLNDLMAWKRLPARLASTGFGLLGAAIVVMNASILQSVMTAPAVQNSFRSTENLVLGAVNAVPAGGRAVMLSIEGANAMEPSDYRFLSEHVRGGRPTSLAAAFAFEPGESGPVYWIVEGQPEVDVFPQLLELVCPGARIDVRDGEVEPRAVAVGSVGSPAQCHAMPRVGWHAVYTLQNAAGEVSSEHGEVPVLGAYSIPWEMLFKLLTSQLQRFEVQWQAALTPPSAGPYRFWLSTFDASGELHVGGRTVSVTRRDGGWSESEALEVGLDGEVEIRATARSERPGHARVRVFWEPPGATRRLIEPKALRPAVPVESAR